MAQSITCLDFKDWLKMFNNINLKNILQTIKKDLLDFKRFFCEAEIELYRRIA